MNTRDRLDNLARRQSRLNGDRANRAVDKLGLYRNEIDAAGLNTALLDLLVDAIHLGEEFGVAVELEALLREAADIFHVEHARTDQRFLSELEPSLGAGSPPAAPPEDPEAER